MRPNPAWRGDPVFLPDVFRAFGVKFREYPGWKQWGMGDFGRINGVFWHHTGSSNTSAQFIRNNPMLGNALSSQLHTAPDGLQTILGAGIAYHAGKGWGCGYPTNNANSFSIGFEMQHNGTDAWPEAQLESTRRATAAILWFLGKRATVETMTAHWEYSLKAQGKWDPGRGDGISGHMMDMNIQRRKVNELIDRFNKYGTLNPAKKEATPVTNHQDNLYKQITKFISGYLGPQIEALQEVWRQLRGPEGKGWPQLGQNSKGQNLTLVDAVAALRQDLARIENRLDQNGAQ